MGFEKIGDKDDRIGKELIQSVIKSEEIERIKAQTDDGSISFYRK